MKEPIKTLDGLKGCSVGSKRTICEVHRQIYDLVVLHFSDRPKKVEKIVKLLEEAFDMGIKLCDKLVEHKLSLLNWEINEDREEIKRLRDLRIELRSQKWV